MENKADPTNWVILKFGGSSVGESKHWQTIADQVKLNTDKGLRPLLVLSALKNVSNLLEELLHKALAGDHPSAIEHLKRHHLEFASQLGLELSQQLSPWFKQLKNDCEQIHQASFISAKSHAKVVSVGELLSTTIGFNYLNQHFDSKKIKFCWQDARLLLKSKRQPTNQNDQWHHYTSAECDYQIDLKFEEQFTQNSCNELDQNPMVFITQGFIASDENGDTVLLGREGSDTSAAYLGAKLNAQSIQIWTDVPGVFSCNPQQNNQAKQLKHLNYLEAKQMAQFGAKVLHPRALQPATDSAIPLLVKSTHHPVETGSLIDKQIKPLPAIKAVVNESPVIFIKQSIDYKQSLEKLFALGYDIIFKIEDSLTEVTNSATILHYNNSDMDEPNLESLTLLFNQNTSIANCTSTILNKLALISIIGTASESEWIQKVKQFCVNQKQLSLLQLFSSRKQGRVNLLVAEETSEKWCHILHQELIENERCQNQFGPGWLDF